MNYSSIISIDSLNIKAHIGLTEEERAKPQDIMVHVKLYLPKIPDACLNDNIDDTICYFKICKIIKSFCRDTECKLLEYLTYQLYMQIRASLNKDVKIRIRTDKCKPPIKDLCGAASFEYSDL